MKKFVILLALAALCVFTAGNAFAAGNKGNLGNPGVASPQSIPYGTSYSQWSTDWWLYTIPLPLSVSPFGHGTDGTINQSEPVWFLGGTFTGDNLIREITIPTGTALFFPVFDVECSTLEPPESGFHGDNEAEMRACANGWVDQFVDGDFGVPFCTVDGVPIENVTQYRFGTSLMTFYFPDPIAANDNIFATPIPAGTTVQSVGDGVYLLLRPLPVGTHTLELPFGIQYTIHVAPRN